jgi:hypothetical protein
MSRITLAATRIPASDMLIDAMGAILGPANSSQLPQSALLAPKDRQNRKKTPFRYDR